jgi:heme exporter protein D
MNRKPFPHAFAAISLLAAVALIWAASFSVKDILHAERCRREREAKEQQQQARTVRPLVQVAGI